MKKLKKVFHTTLYDRRGLTIVSYWIDKNDPICIEVFKRDTVVFPTRVNSGLAGGRVCKIKQKAN